MRTDFVWNYICIIGDYKDLTTKERREHDNSGIFCNEEVNL